MLWEAFKFCLTYSRTKSQSLPKYHFKCLKVAHFERLHLWNASGRQNIILSNLFFYLQIYHSQLCFPARGELNVNRDFMFVVHKSNIPLKFSSLFFHHHQRKKVWELKRGEETNTQHHQALQMGKTSKLMTHHNNVTQDKKDIISFLVWWKGKENIEINKKIHFCIDVICLTMNVPCIFSTLVPAPPAPPSYYYKLCQVFVFDIEKNCEMAIWAERSREGTSIHVKSSSWPLPAASRHKFPSV